MEDKISSSYKYAFFESISPLYLDKLSLLDIVKMAPNFEINDNNEDLYGSLELFFNKYRDLPRIFVIIYTDNIDLAVQGRLVGFVKDRNYRSLKVPSNCKIIVVGNHNDMNRELFGLLTVL